uniref:Myb-like domain-containing protein n=1 Tax=Noctiluca scintillans TaxID=2966 RepID=A0A7S1B229_NOCSC
MQCAKPGALRCLAQASKRCFCDDAPPKWAARYPPRFFDFKAFRDSLRTKKSSLEEAEAREIRREYAKPPPQGWTVIDFLQKMEFGDGAEEVAALFETWEDFISMNGRDALRIPNITHKQRGRLSRHLRLFNHGMWPRLRDDVFAERFKGKPLENEGKPWTSGDDENLLKLAEKYDVNFGDPWIYISWEMQRRETDVRDRYMRIVEMPRERLTRCELGITKSSRPLLMNRKFRMIPCDLYIVPSERNFELIEAQFQLPEAFEKYRQADIF